MLKTITNKSYSKVSGSIVLITLIIFMVFIILVLPKESKRSDEYFGDSPVPDSSFIYTEEDLYNMADNFGTEGRAYYIRSRFTFDIVWPLAYGFFLWASIAYFGRAFKHSIIRYTVLLPILGVILDYMENLGASYVMFMYPARTPFLPYVVPIFTLSKWLIIVASFVVLVLLVVYKVYYLFLHKKT